MIIRASIALLKSTASKALIGIMLAGAVTLSGCATDRTHTGSVQKRGHKTLDQMNVDELNKTITYLGARYTKKPKDKKTGIEYATALRMAGRNEQALSVMRQMVIYHPTDNNVLSAYGKALASNGELLKALETVRRAQRPDNPDWKLLSAEGAILDQLDRPQEAREFYRKALLIAPGESSIYSNLGMSHLLTSELPAAEQYLRKAIAIPGSDSRVRQNLALVVGLQGNFQEAEKIATGELNTREAEANVAYLRQMLKQQNAWSQLKKEDKAAK